MSQYHDILRVSPGASQEEIKEAFRERALECHPDRATEGKKEEAQEEFRRVREAFEILSDDEEKRPRDVNGDVDDEENADTRPRRRSYKEAWRKHKNQRVHVGKDIIENVRGLAGEYRLIRQKNAMTIPVGALLGAITFLYDPGTMHGTGIALFDVLLAGLVGSVYGFAAGSLWAYLDLFLQDYAN